LFSWPSIPKPAMSRQAAYADRAPEDVVTEVLAKAAMLLNGG